jgi:hypothetical protein
MVTAPYEIKILGTDTAVTTDSASEVLITTLTTLADITSITMKCFTFFEDWEDEGEILESEGFIKLEQPIQRNTYEFELEEIYPSTDIQVFRDLRSVLKKQNKFIYEVHSPYSVPINTSGKAIAVVITHERSKDKGLIPVKLTCMKRKPN